MAFCFQISRWMPRLVLMRQKPARSGPFLLAAFVALASILTFCPPVRAVDLPKNPAIGAHKPVTWLTSFQIAAVQQQKTNKLILMYFSGSGWDDFTLQLDEQVFSTDAFRIWADQNIIPLRVDFPKDTSKESPWIKKQNQELKLRFTISQVPTFLFVDEAGDVLARVGYDTAHLRKEEAKDHPDAWIAFCDKVVKDSPRSQDLLVQKNLTEAIAFSRKHAIPLALFINQGTNPLMLQEKAAILKHPAFIKFVNRNMTFLDVKWPEDFDITPAGKQMRDFAKQWKFGPAPLEIVVWSPAGLGEFKDQITSVSVQNIQPLLKRLDADLPRIDYNGGWIDDYRTAMAICHQQKKDLFISFEQSDDKSWSQNWQHDVYDTPEFKKYAKENFVLLRADFSKTTTQPVGLVEQNKNLADMYAIRGYPTMIILNPLAQKIGEAKYMKGGVAAFIPALDRLRREDHDRRVLPSEEAAKGT